MNATIARLLDQNGELPAFAFPGAYPIYYLDRQNSVLCPTCANQEIGDGSIPDFLPYAYGIVEEEEEEIYCDQCSCAIG